MTTDGRSTRRRRLSLLGVVTGLGAIVCATVSAAASAPVGLGTAISFAVLAGAGVTNTGPSVVTGDLGTCPTPAVTGFPPGVVVNGTVHAADAVACQAQSDLTTAYNDAAGRAPTATFSGPTDLGGMTLMAGVYTSPSSLAITGTLTLDAQGDPDAVFIFQAGSTLITAPNSRVVLINGAQACNVFWKVGSSATLGVGSTFVGTILALTAITANTGVNVQGRLLARNAAVTLDSNTVTRPVCAPPTTTSSTTTSSTTTSSTTTSSTTTIATTTSTTLAPTTTTRASTTTTVATTTTTLAPTTTTTVASTTTTITTAPTTTTTVAPTTTSVASTTTTVGTTTTTLDSGTLPDDTTTTSTISRSSTTTTSATTTTGVADVGSAPGGGAGSTAAPGATDTGGGGATAGGGAGAIRSEPGEGRVVAQGVGRSLALTGSSAQRDVAAAGGALLIGSLLLLLSEVRAPADEAAEA